MKSIKERLDDFNNGKLEPNEIVELFSEMIKKGVIIVKNQQITANALIENGFLSEKGEVLKLV